MRGGAAALATLGPDLDDRTEAFLRAVPGGYLGPAVDLAGPTVALAAEMRQIHDEIWPILERYAERVKDPSRRPPDARAGWVFFLTGISPRR